LKREEKRSRKKQGNKKEENKMAIKVYSTQTCPWCHRLKDYLKSKGVEFEDIDVSENQEAADEMVEKSGQMGVPVTDINGKIIVGFDQAAIDAELAKIEKPAKE
jgi:glutaredoxin 3